MTPVLPLSELEAENSDCRRQRPFLPGVCISAKGNNATFQVLCVKFLTDMCPEGYGNKGAFKSAGRASEGCSEEVIFLSILKDK